MNSADFDQNQIVWRGMRLRNHEVANYMRLMQIGGQINIMGFASVTKKLPTALQNAMRPVAGLTDEDSMPVIM